VDIGRTVLGRAGINPYNGMQGIDLLASSRPAGRAMVVESEQVMHKFDQGRSFRVRSLVDPRYRLSVSDIDEIGELYDLDEDPAETANLWTSAPHQDVKARLLERLCREQIRLGDEAPLPTALA